MMIKYPVESGRWLIEASAGTGKTYTITELYRRLVLERHLHVNEILVVTFSKAAAAELKERISKMLNDSLICGWKNEAGETVLPSTGEKLLLELAAASMDEANISTIHSFCQKMLSDFALESGTPFEMTLVSGNSNYIDKLLRNFWRKKFITETIPDISFHDLVKTSEIAFKAGEPNAIVTIPPGKEVCAELLKQMRTDLKTEKAKAGAVTFDDLIVNLREALSDPVFGEHLASKIRTRYKAVFVDEFQDTDSDQFYIFDKCFPQNCESVLFYMIGDPKQAIYAFRGADIYSYLYAKENIPPGHRFTLTKNFRSSPEMIDAVNTIFSGLIGRDNEGVETVNAFLQEGIPYVNVASGRHPDDFLVTENGKPITTPFQIRFRQGVKTSISESIFTDSAQEIASLLSVERNIRIGKKQRPLSSSDIAVLLPTHNDVRIMKQELGKYGINASSPKKSNVYESAEGEILLCVLQAAAEPSGTNIRQALISDFFAFTPEMLDKSLHDPLDTVQEAWTVWFQDAGRIWRKKGIYSLMSSLLDRIPPGKTETSRVMILSSLDGERAMTNYLQMTELLRAEEINNKLSPENLLEFFRNAQEGRLSERSPDADEETDPDSIELRLDRDADTVHLMTMFAAKGLQFPVVFVPFPVNSAAGKRPKDQIYVSARDKEHVYYDFRDEKDPGALSFQSQIVFREELRTQLRLLYVAYTRAEYLCYSDIILPDSTRGSNLNKSASGAIQMSVNPSELVKERLEKIASFGIGEIPDAAPWTNGESGLINVITVKKEGPKECPDPGTLRKDNRESIQLEALPRPDISRLWRIMSYSAFQYGNHQSAPDGKDLCGKVDENEESFQYFPGGIDVGTFFHKQMEFLARPITDKSLSFQSFCDLSANREMIEWRIRNALRSLGISQNDEKFELRFKQLLDGFVRAVCTPLPPDGLSLSALDRAKCIPEMEFNLETDNTYSLKKILDCVKEYSSDAIGKNLVEIDGSGEIPVSGILNGFMDLVFISGGKYYIADWKTDKLPNYSAEMLRKDMGIKGYYLQEHLYTVALVQILKTRIDFSYERDFGGVLYLFPRGMNSTGNGIYFDRPSEECIKQLINVMRNGDEK